MMTFTCNLCGTSNTVEAVPWEASTCRGCGSNVRMRSLIYMLAAELFGEALPLPEFPECDAIKGFGMSDALCYATPLAEKLDYSNTFYDRQPYLDITKSHPEEHGTYDFILSSDVFEHVAPPIERAFEEAFRLLKPNGFLCVTVPSSHLAEETVEHYPDLFQYSVIKLAGEHVLINRRADKTLEIYGNLDFHGGIGATLVMRLFAMKDLERKLRAAGFSDVVLQLEPVERFGIVFEGPWSRPFVARKQPFHKMSASARPSKTKTVSRSERPAPPASTRRLRICTRKKPRSKTAWIRPRCNCDWPRARAGSNSAADWVWARTWRETNNDSNFHPDRAINGER
jgi:SAM-dependent methyltransferase